MKYKVGDKVRLKGTDNTGTVEKIIRGNYVVRTSTSKVAAFPEDLILIEGLVEDEMIDLTSIVMETVEEKTIQNALAYGYNLPDGYQFKDENGNVINATKIVLEKKKKEYPKTYEECYQVTGLSKTSDIYGYKNGLLFEFQKLLIARDAYWKIAGEEMGLGGPWEPDWTNEHQVKYTIYTMGNDVIRHVGNYIHAILAFPTAEMRDAFYENFKELINECKELL